MTKETVTDQAQNPNPNNIEPIHRGPGALPPHPHRGVAPGPHSLTGQRDPRLPVVAADSPIQVTSTKGLWFRV
ncbi:unnamed protein product [Linum trigynum]|uniref:Uncharacterized protein n=1 Tax=Linum trigynum TaxID=586398 RepID=A0AAV2DLA7_9ROSI